ncbi:dihydroneopterin triphosphate diphosphatase [Seminibacterium arietis]|uniref:Dihydroneopterin triphosphate diphosphatase n=1 Tax=Seminibacterium arietis TaxID=1173502 RepID=A0ABW3I760_9PAST
MTKYKSPLSVLVLIYHQISGKVLMLQRNDDQEFWQSVTGSLEEGETPYQAAIREVKEETGLDILVENLPLFNCNEAVVFEIFPQFRYKYAPNVTTVTEHWFLLAVPNLYEPKLIEHQAYQWLSAKQAAELTKSWNNKLIIEKYLIRDKFL